MANKTTTKKSAPDAAATVANDAQTKKGGTTKTVKAATPSSPAPSTEVSEADAQAGAAGTQQGTGNAPEQKNPPVDTKGKGATAKSERNTVIERYRKHGAADIIYMTSDNLGFLRERDAKAYANTLPDKTVDEINVSQPIKQ